MPSIAGWPVPAGAFLPFPSHRFEMLRVLRALRRLFLWRAPFLPGLPCLQSRAGKCCERCCRTSFFMEMEYGLLEAAQQKGFGDALEAGERKPHTSSVMTEEKTLRKPGRMLRDRKVFICQSWTAGRKDPASMMAQREGMPFQSTGNAFRREAEPRAVSSGREKR